MQRQLVSRDEIMRLVNERIRQPLYGGASTLGGDGCNWQECGFNGIYTEGFRHAVIEIRAKYNIQDEA